MLGQIVHIGLEFSSEDDEIERERQGDLERICDLFFDTSRDRCKE
jgi:hypothetical protein